jgi:hypothetical protein
LPEVVEVEDDMLAPGVVLVDTARLLILLLNPALRTP